MQSEHFCKSKATTSEHTVIYISMQSDTKFTPTAFRAQSGICILIFYFFFASFMHNYTSSLQNYYMS